MSVQSMLNLMLIFHDTGINMAAQPGSYELCRSIISTVASNSSDYCFNCSEVHELLHTTNKAVHIDKNDDGDHAHLVLTTLDLSHWTLILYVSTLENNVDKASQVPNEQQLMRLASSSKI
jgi:hypothetical protein